MGRKRNPAPQIHVHNGSVQARYTTDAGRQKVTLGREDDPKGWKAAHARLMLRLANDPNAVLHARGEMVCSELAVEYLAQYRSTPDRRRIVKRALMLWAGPGSEFCRWPVRDFGSPQIEAFQTELIGTTNPKYKAARRFYTATTINSYVGIVRAAFKYAVRKQWATYEQYESLGTVPGVRADHEGLQPVTHTVGIPLDRIRTIRPYLQPPPRAILDLQLLTGARPGVLFRLTAEMLVRGGVVDLPKVGLINLDELPGEPWAYCPDKHKLAHKGKVSVILLGPEARAILDPFLVGRPADAPLFSPADAVQFMRAKAKAERAAWNEQVRAKQVELGVKAAAAAGWTMRFQNRKKAVENPKRRPGGRYTRTSYRNAVIRACKAAGVPAFTPYRLRNTALQLAELATDLDGAAALAGHSSVVVTKRYTKRNIQRAALAAAGVAELLGGGVPGHTSDGK